jgi:hypothetical protein
MDWRGAIIGTVVMLCFAVLAASFELLGQAIDERRVRRGEEERPSPLGS